MCTVGRAFRADDLGQKACVRACVCMHGESGGAAGARAAGTAGYGVAACVCTCACVCMPCVTRTDTHTCVRKAQRAGDVCPRHTSSQARPPARPPAHAPARVHTQRVEPASRSDPKVSAMRQQLDVEVAANCEGVCARMRSPSRPCTHHGVAWFVAVLGTVLGLVLGVGTCADLAQQWLRRSC
jgi:hypothetical protein